MSVPEKLSQVAVGQHEVEMIRPVGLLGSTAPFIECELLDTCKPYSALTEGLATSHAVL